MYRGKRVKHWKSGRRGVVVSWFLAPHPRDGFMCWRQVDVDTGMVDKGMVPISDTHIQYPSSLPIPQIFHPPTLKTHPRARGICGIGWGGGIGYGYWIWVPFLCQPFICPHLHFSQCGSSLKTKKWSCAASTLSFRVEAYSL